MCIRTMGWRRVAEQELSLLSPETLSYLEAFSAGVNATWTATRLQMSLEYSCSRSTGSTAPEGGPRDSVAWLRRWRGTAATWRRRSSAR